MVDDRRSLYVARFFIFYSRFYPSGEEVGRRYQLHERGNIGLSLGQVRVRCTRSSPKLAVNFIFPLALSVTTVERRYR